MKHAIVYRTVLAGIVAWFGMTAFGSAARADATEGRIYLDVSYAAYARHDGALHLSLKPFMRMESRFRDSGLVYAQWNTGLRLGVLPWLSAAAYYSPRQQMYAGKPNTFKHLAGLDLIFHHSIDGFRLLNRETSEWHATDAFYRYRNFSEVMYTTPAKWLSLFANEEFRVDADEERVNMNNVAGGLQFDPLSSLTFRVFYDFESCRRKAPQWQNVNFVGISTAVHL